MSSKEKTESSNQNKKTDLGLLEEDDDFEEFPAEGKYCSVVVCFSWV